MEHDRSLDTWILGSPRKSPYRVESLWRPQMVCSFVSPPTLEAFIFFTLAWPTGPRACTSVFPHALPFMYINIAKETPVYTVTCFGQTDIYLLLYNGGNLHSALKIWPHWLVLPLPQRFLHSHSPLMFRCTLLPSPGKICFAPVPLASVGAHAVRKALHSHVKSCWTWQGGSAFKGRCRILSYVILWDGPLRQNCVMGLALKSLACLSGLNGNDMKTRLEHKPGLLRSTVIHTHQGDQQRNSRALLASVNYKFLL